jgi:hypothetical protein
MKLKKKYISMGVLKNLYFESIKFKFSKEIIIKNINKIPLKIVNINIKILIFKK